MRGMLCFKEEKRMQQEYLQIGEIVRPQGIRGEVKLRAMTEDMSRYARLESVFLKKNGQMEEKKVLKGRSSHDFAMIYWNFMDARLNGNQESLERALKEYETMTRRFWRRRAASCRG